MDYKELYLEEVRQNAQLHAEVETQLADIQTLWEALQFAVLHFELNADLIDQYKAVLESTQHHVTSKMQ